MENAALFGFPALTYLTPSDQLIFIASLSQICYNNRGFLYEFLFCLWACPLRCRNFFQHVKPHHSFHNRPSPFFRRFHPVIPIYYLCIWQQFCLVQSNSLLYHITASSLPSVNHNEQTTINLTNFFKKFLVYLFFTAYNGSVVKTKI